MSKMGDDKVSIPADLQQEIEELIKNRWTEESTKNKSPALKKDVLKSMLTQKRLMQEEDQVNPMQISFKIKNEKQRRTSKELAKPILEEEDMQAF